MKAPTDAPDPPASLEADRLLVQARLDQARTPTDRNRWGQFATPPALAAALVAAGLDALGHRPVRFLDPAVGSGAFFSALLAANHAIDRALGFELDPAVAKEASRLWTRHGLDLRQADFTTASPEPRSNLLICNPPYVRHQHLPPATKSALRARLAALGLPASGLMGLYGYFLLLSLGWVEPGGVSVWLIPGEILDVGYGAAVRATLAERVTVLRVHRSDPRVPSFDDALVSSAVLILRHTPPPADHRARFTTGAFENPDSTDNILQSALALSRWPPQAPPPAGSTPLGALFQVKRGLATGGNELFILPAARAAALKLPPDLCRPMLPPPRRLKTDFVDALPDGAPKLSEQLVLLHCSIAPETLAQAHPALWRHLQTGVPEVSGGHLCRNRQPWYAQESRAPAPILCTYMGRLPRPFRFIRNRSAALAGNVYLNLYPRQPMAEARLDEIWRALQALDVQTLTGCGRVYGGGLHKLEPRELASLPLIL